MLYLYPYLLPFTLCLKGNYLTLPRPICRMSYVVYVSYDITVSIRTYKTILVRGDQQLRNLVDIWYYHTFYSSTPVLSMRQEKLLWRSCMGGVTNLLSKTVDALGLPVCIARRNTPTTFSATVCLPGLARFYA